MLQRTIAPTLLSHGNIAGIILGHSKIGGNFMAASAVSISPLSGEICSVSVRPGDPAAGAQASSATLQPYRASMSCEMPASPFTQELHWSWGHDFGCTAGTAVPGHGPC